MKRKSAIFKTKQIRSSLPSITEKKKKMSGMERNGEIWWFSIDSKYLVESAGEKWAFDVPSRSCGARSRIHGNAEDLQKKN